MVYNTRSAGFVDLHSFKCRLNVDIPELKYSRDEKTYPSDDIPKVKHDQSSLRLLDLIRPILLQEGQKFINVFNYIEGEIAEKGPLHRQVQRLALRLHLFSQIPTINGKMWPEELYLINSLTFGPEFAEFLSKLRSAMFMKTVRSTDLIKKNSIFISEYEDNSRYGVIPKQDKWDYDSILNERFLIDYEETGSDFHWAYKDLNESSDAVSLFREAARSLLLSYKTEIKVATEEDASMWISDSITPTDDGPKINRILMREMAESGRSSTVLERSPDSFIPTFNRSGLSIEPGNYRDTWQCFPDTLFMVKRVSHILRQVLQPIPYSAMCDPHLAYKRKRLLKTKANFFMFDFKKCGLTVNRHLLTILGEELNSIYPGKGFDELLRFHTVKVWNGSIAHFPPRGVGLGNCNEGITLIQCVVGHMLRGQGISSIFFNDDGVFQVEHDGYQNVFLTIASLFRKLGMILNLEKTLISKSNVFCEEFQVDESLNYSKTQLLLLGFANIFFKRNIASAKSLYFSLRRNLIGRRMSINILGSLISWYGFEFHPFERFLPFEFGGWEYCGRTSVNEVIRYVFSLHDYVEEHGYIPIIRRWIGFLVLNHQSRTDLLKRKNIRFRKFVSNPFCMADLKELQSDWAVDLLHSIGLRSNKEEIEILNDVYNIRGSKNCKPKLKSGLIDKLYQARKSLYRQFKLSSHQKKMAEFGGHLNSVLEYIRGVEITPHNLLPPDFLIYRTETISEPDQFGRVYYPKVKDFGKDFGRSGLNQMAESLLFGRILPGSSIFSIRRRIIINNKAPIISDVTLSSPKGVIYPDYTYLFLGDPKVWGMVYSQIKRSDEFPVGFHTYKSFPDLGGSLSPLKTLFPSIEKEIDRLFYLCKQNKSLALMEELFFIYGADNPDRVIEIMTTASEFRIHKEGREVENIRVLDYDDTLFDEIVEPAEDIDELMNFIDEDIGVLDEITEMEPEFVEEPDDTLIREEYLSDCDSDGYI
jgi:hypothetical protein